MKAGFFEDGFAVYDADPPIAAWVEAALPLAQHALKDTQLRKDWLRCEGTWFVGVDALPTGPEGEAGETTLSGSVIHDLNEYLPFEKPLHKAQLSAVFPGYPKPREGEGDAAFRYRLKRDAAHVDGLHAIGPARQRHLVEYHAYLLGIPINLYSADASPLVVWRNSHSIIREALASKLSGCDPEQWPDVDLTDVYQNARRVCFDECERIELPVKPGQALVMHRHLLHGIAPWGSEATAPLDGRMIAYFRPEISGDRSRWLDIDKLL